MRPLEGASPALGDEQGGAAVEFALVLPLMLAVILGSADLFDAVSAERRIGRLCQTIADMAVESEELDASGAALIRDAAETLIFGLDPRYVDIDIESFGAHRWAIDLRVAEEPAPHSQDHRSIAELGADESLIQAACSYRFLPRHVTFLPIAIELEAVAIAAPKKAEFVDWIGP